MCYKFCYFDKGKEVFSDEEGNLKTIGGAYVGKANYRKPDVKEENPKVQQQPQNDPMDFNQDVLEYVPSRVAPYVIKLMQYRGIMFYEMPIVE